MRLRGFLTTITAVVSRMSVHRDARYSATFDSLADLVIRASNEHFVREGGEALLNPFRGMIEDHIDALDRKREARFDRKLGGLPLPGGCRFGNLQFSPVLQLAKLYGLPQLDRVDIEPLPLARPELHAHFLNLIGLPPPDALTPAALKTVLGFRLDDYISFLLECRRTDAPLYMKLLAHEFRLAREQIGAEDPRMTWVNRGAALAELARLVEIVRFLDGRPLNIDELRQAIEILLKPRGARTAAQRWQIAKARPLIEQLGYCVESLRALFLGDRAVDPIAKDAFWSDVTDSMRIRAIARGAWLCKQSPLVANGFRFPKRIVRGRRRSAYAYYGITLDMLLLVGLHNLAESCGQAGGAIAIATLANDIELGLRSNGNYRASISLSSNRDAHTASLYSEIYLRDAGHGGGSNRFDWRYWFEAPADDALYGRLWGTFIGDASQPDEPSVRSQITAAVTALKQVMGSKLMFSGPIDPRLAASAMGQLACGLTPVAMDPIYVALTERALVERGYQTGMRKDPIVGISVADIVSTLKRFRLIEFRALYARFTPFHGPPNQATGQALTPPLTSQRTLPKPLRRAASAKTR